MRMHNVDGDSKRMGIDKGKIVPRVEEDVGGGRARVRGGGRRDALRSATAAELSLAREFR